MAKVITEEAKEYLRNTKNINLATIISIEVPGTSNELLRVTDYKRDIFYKGFSYESGKVKSISDIIRTHKLTANTVSIKLTGADEEEVSRAINSGSYLNRKVSITRCIILPSGEILPHHADGSSQLIFEGTTTEISVDEQASSTGVGSSVVTWKCANEFYNLDQVNGRITDDASHRGLVVNEDGIEVPSTAAKKFEYQEDTGFFHANQSINVLATYQTEEKHQKLKKKSKWGGLKTEYSMVDYWVTVTKEVELQFNLAAKYIPVCYGVTKLDGIPVFADTLADNPNKVFVVYAFCEGEIEGFYDILLDGKPMICMDTADSEDRVCFGQKREQGDTMGVAALAPGGETSIGSVHGREYVLEDGDGEVRMWTYHGTLNQPANPRLVEVAAAGNFFGQSGFDSSNTRNAGPEYWDQYSTLKDTAYLVMEFNMTDQRTNIPTISAEIKGKKVSTFDYNGLVRNDKTSNNTAWQILDYLRSSLYGPGVTLDRIDLDSFVVVADLFDLVDTSYDTSWAPYWRYLGWDSSNDPANRAVVQTNTLLDTDSSLFKNMESMLDQSVCSLNIVNGQYTLTVEAESQETTEIQYSDVVDGKLSVSDITSKNKFNTVSAGIPDPGNGWNTTEVTFFDSDYLAEDLGVEKKLTMNFPHMTNYYTARSLAERELRKSRFNREVKLTLPYYFAELKINFPILLSYPRFGWVNKEFLLRGTKEKSNGRVEVTLREYSEGIFINSQKPDKGSEQRPQLPNLIKPPRHVRFVPAVDLDDDEQFVGKQGELRWDASYSTDVTYYSVIIEGISAAYIVPVDQFPQNTPYFSLDISGLPVQNHVIQVRAVSGPRGLSSSPVTTTVYISPTITLPVVELLRLTNQSSSNTTIWIGSAPLFAWNPIDGDKYGIEQNTIKYDVQITKTEGDILTEYVSFITTATYPLEDNIADYALEFGESGAYRNISIRVRAFTDSGAQSVDWATL